MIAAPMCECPAAADWKAASIRMTFPEDVRREVNPLLFEVLSTVTCGECGQMLKPSGTIYRDGQLMTVPV